MTFSMSVHHSAPAESYVSLSTLCTVCGVSSQGSQSLATASAFLDFCIALKKPGVEQTSYGGPGSLPARGRRFTARNGSATTRPRSAHRREFFQGREHKVEGGFEEIGLEEEVRIVRPEIKIGCL